PLIRRIDEIVVAVGVVGVKGRLVAHACEERRNNRSESIVVVHGRQTEQLLHGANGADRGVEVAVYESAAFGAMWGVFADDERDAAVGFHMIGAGLRIIFEDKKGCVIPEGRVR